MPNGIPFKTRKLAQGRQLGSVFQEDIPPPWGLNPRTTFTVGSDPTTLEIRQFFTDQDGSEVQTLQVVHYTDSTRTVVESIDAATIVDPVAVQAQIPVGTSLL